jgi:hypothetical protein
MIRPDCMICDLYAVFDKHLADDRDEVADVVADLVTVLPPRGHGFHHLAILEQHYRTRILT